ncbi:MAG: hypothetical protein JO041_13615 [Acidobacteria bacterium]|nr:hypothetical protein [Acidobacteriota bacterium]
MPAPIPAQGTGIQLEVSEIAILTVGCNWALRQAPAGALSEPHSVSFAENLQECAEALNQRSFRVLVIGPDLDEAGQNRAVELGRQHKARTVLLFAGNAPPVVDADVAVPVRGPMRGLMNALEESTGQVSR